MESLTELKNQLTAKLNEENSSFEFLQETALALEKTIKLLDQKELRWLELSEKL
jgi:hypothetical protein